MDHASLSYDYPLFRPPGEANSLILQITLGCSWNKCTFCEMYTTKKFRIKKIEDVKSEIELCRRTGIMPAKVFLADGDAFTLKTDYLIEILEYINKTFPGIRKISAYAKPKDIFRKSENELKEIYAAGLNLVYVGLETGDDHLLQIINKGENQQTMTKALLKLKKSGIKSSVMIINGLGGNEFSNQHAVNSADLLNQIQPDYLSTLVLSFPFGEDHYRNRLQTGFTSLGVKELIEELGVMISRLSLESTIFRSDHASNYLILKGVLNKDKERLLEHINRAVHEPGKINLRPEWRRGL